MANARKLPSGSYRTQVFSHYDYVDGKKVRRYESFTAPTPEEAEYLASEFKLNRKRTKIKSNLTFEIAAESYIKDKENVLSPATVRGYTNMLKNNFDDIKAMSLKDIDEDVVQRWINKSALTYSSKTINNQLGFISTVLKKNKIRIDFSELTRKKKSKKDILIPSEIEVKKLLDAVKGSNIEIPVILAALCGLRQSEIVACKWERLNKNVLRVQGSKVPDKNNVLVEKATNKSYAGTRDIILVDYAVLRLSYLRGNNKDGYMTDMIPSSILRALKRTCKQIGITEYTMHSLRHYHASVMLSMNVPDKYAMEILGQNSPHMLKQTYQHTFSDEFIKINGMINEHYKGLLE